MPEGLNVEVAHKLTEKEEEVERRKHRWEEVVEVIEVLVLSLAAIATAWSGFQASQWDERQGFSYGQATTQRFAASAASTLGGQQLAADSAMFSSWLGARAAGNADLEMVLVRRFTPDYRQAFDEWIKTDPLNNPSAPPGPGYMPGYKNPNLEKAEQLNIEAAELFTAGTEAGEKAGKYVRMTVLFALVLFLIAAGQRFKQRLVRISANVLAVCMLAYALVYLILLPRI
ncbi:MAG TPA: hypothetical protein VFP34_18610 [Microlunatus sp.]|nr:hypothetical protein [Microlunatus sp.]